MAPAGGDAVPPAHQIPVHRVPHRSAQSIQLTSEARASHVGACPELGQFFPGFGIFSGRFPDRLFPGEVVRVQRVVIGYPPGGASFNGSKRGRKVAV